MKVFEAIADAVVAHGVDTVFGLLGDANMFLVADLVNRHGVRFVAARNENAAVMMADGYARTTGRCAVATVTQGPGAVAGWAGARSPPPGPRSAMSGWRPPRARDRSGRIPTTSTRWPAGYVRRNARCCSPAGAPSRPRTAIRELADRSGPCSPPR